MKMERGFSNGAWHYTIRDKEFTGPQITQPEGRQQVTIYSPTTGASVTLEDADELRLALHAFQDVCARLGIR